MSQSPPGQPSKTKAILEEVDKVKNVMHDNIGLMLNNNEKAQNLQDKTASMNNNARLFKKQTGTIRRQMWCRNMKLQIIIILVVILVLAVILIPIILKFV
ncbi:synaptobrevin domain-containing protein [Tieghemostelium lacteum]|uniref:Synaptobrevin domain-containing protein n=1 Tax=Tieghemostelium lacteum TaxID=361077 RepID=A0A152A0S5_TIELA|nr:synaptobrevin domain-containing protein [Tieghemostelium lacteum]|eukprot:KYQ99847.1 synaptobrevin domain-containing protein [Tieghemostelium lacteum]